MSFTFLLLVGYMMLSYTIVAQLKIDRSLWFSSHNACLISLVEAIGLAGLSFLSFFCYNSITALLMDGRFHKAKQTLSNRAIAGH